MVTQPRSPCYKLNIRFGRDDMIKRFVRGGRSGFYLAIETPGELEASDAIKIVGRTVDAESVASVVREKFKLE